MFFVSIRNRWFPRGLMSILLLFAHPGITSAAEAPELLEDVIDRQAEAAVGAWPGFGLAIGVVDGPRTQVVCVGQTSVGGGAPDEHTLFEIGSVTKTFTALLLADSVIRSAATLDEPLEDVLGSACPKFEDHAIRLVEVATQTSGLPRLPPNMGFVINPWNPYARYSGDDAVKCLAQFKLQRAPGTKYEYSNFGFGVLGFALAKQAGKTYEELLRERICDRLKMSDTRITLSADQQTRLATGLSTLGVPTTNWEFEALAGCGAIRSTLHDMLIFLRANLAPGGSPLQDAIELTHKARFTIREPSKKFPDKLEIGLAWHITTDAGEKIIWHNGMTGGYAAYVAFVPAQQLGIVVLGNSASGKIDELGNGLLSQLMKEKKAGD